MMIRQERTEDFAKIYELVKIAFQTAKVSDGKEQDFVNHLRNSNAYTPELALVAEEEGTLIGHIMLNKTRIVKDHIQFETLYIAPLSVILEYRNRGVGTALIKESFRLAREKGYTSVFLVGDPNYYHRFGFVSSIRFDVTTNLKISEENVMGCELIPNALKEVSGIINL